MRLVRLARRVRNVDKRFREARMLARSRSPYRPVAAHLIPIRRCNLSCTYCNEYDDHSPPVPTHDVLRRVDRLAMLGTGIITLSGGEPLLHPDLDEIIRRIRSHGVIATLITNGYLLSRERISRLNRAGLDHLQISIDNVLPDEVSKKSLKLLDQKLQWLAAEGEFDVTVNSVVGGGIRNPDDALIITRRARELGLSTTVGIIHDHSGQLKPLDEHQRDDSRAGRGCRDVDVRFRELQPVSEEPRQRAAERLALRRRKPVPVRLRGRPRALVLSAARPSRHSARSVWP